MLEKKENVLVKKAAAEVEKAKEFTTAKNKRGMSQQRGLRFTLVISVGISVATLHAARFVN